MDDDYPPVWLAHVSKSFPRTGEAWFGRRSKSRRMVLRDVNLSIGPGEIVCVLGKNGSGKTTLTKIVTTLLTPDGGEVRVCGYDVERQGRRVKERIGVVFNAGDSGFQARLSAFSNLEYYGALYGIRRKEVRTRVKHILETIGLGDRGPDQYQSFSTGMKRRLAIARVLLPDPQVLILDEPTLGIDPWSVKQVHELLKSIAVRGKTILCTTNNEMEARNIGAGIRILEDGVLTEPLGKEAVVA